ncbi:hypothetical protein P153DRAFT_386137 [Dothidotthia symphoricarpi CBS 119687]|uniref:Glycoside hydrolase family 16 protein n=1 Tax=Dothidotthia symphoricarpi CBS 119687 TaxID=1392245 RepID=A0A6A6AD85_9PLEO|nr:uncharacterized protein P153DRAFT_386137 [Dothidotthia symphoricarpi CBS 119687]KAF2128934.1 hypothetical protein P153DRAFT_386137 [Dothidotthia symphoricarpi CBS 119687]
MKTSFILAALPFLGLTSAALLAAEAVGEASDKSLVARYSYNWCDYAEHTTETDFTMGLNGWGNNDATED